MSEYDDLMNLSDAKLAEGDSLLQVSESYQRASGAALAKARELRKQAEDIKAEEARAKEVEFIPEEAVEVRDLDPQEWRPGKFVSKDEEGLFVVKCFMSHKGYAANSWIECRRPEDREGIFIRHAGNECPVSDESAMLIVYSGGISRTLRAEEVEWRCGIVTGYVIIPKWALERVK